MIFNFLSSCTFFDQNDRLDKNASWLRFLCQIHLSFHTSTNLAKPLSNWDFCVELFFFSTKWWIGQKSSAKSNFAHFNHSYSISWIWQTLRHHFIFLVLFLRFLSNSIIMVPLGWVDKFLLFSFSLLSYQWKTNSKNLKEIFLIYFCNFWDQAKFTI